MTGIPAVPLKRHLGGFWLPQAAAGTSPPLMPPPRAFRVCASPAATMRPSTRMFLAAFRSRSWVTPHSVQVQDLTARGFLPELNPHPEHSRLEGNQRLTLTTVRWQRSAFSCQQPNQCRPAGVVDRLAQPGPGQAGHGQVLHLDPLVIAGDAVGQSRPGPAPREPGLSACPEPARPARRCPGWAGRAGRCPQRTGRSGRPHSKAGQGARPHQPNVPDLRHPHPASGDAEAVTGQPDPGPVVLTRPEPWVPHLAAPTRTRQGVEPVPVRTARVLTRLHRSNRRDPAQPPTRWGGLGQGHDPALHLRVADLLTARIRVLPGAKRIVEHHRSPTKRPWPATQPGQGSGKHGNGNQRAPAQRNVAHRHWPTAVRVATPAQAAIPDLKDQARAAQIRGHAFDEGEQRWVRCWLPGAPITSGAWSCWGGRPQD
jgi:hypothetical protein